MIAGQHKLLMLTGCTDSSIIPVTVNHGANDYTMAWKGTHEVHGKQVLYFFFKLIFELPYSRKVWWGESFGELIRFEHLAKESLVN